MSIFIRGLTKAAGNMQILDGIDLEAEKGKITAIFGPNGSGKTTILNILAGIVPQDSGSCMIEDFDGRKFSYMFQNYRDTLLPWRNGLDNIALPLQIGKVPKDVAKRKVEESCKLLGHMFRMDKYSYHMSGGEQQAVAFLRAIITSPTTLLLDEPFSALDYENQLRLRDVLQNYYLLSMATVLIVTHSIEEAVYLADEIVVLSQKPARVIGRVKNPLPRPRTIDVMKSKKFHSAKSEVLELFRRAASL